MTAAIISGKQVSEEIRIGIAQEVAELAKRGVKPGLAVILVGEDPGSQVYVRNKENLVSALVSIRKCINWMSLLLKKNCWLS